VAPAETVAFRILGPFEVLRDGQPLLFGPGKERALLAVLVLHRNERVSTNRLIDLLWDESPPESAPKMVQIYVSRLRRTLAGDRGDWRLVTQAAGYRLGVEPDELDLDRFERLCNEGRNALAAGDAALATLRLGEALSLWRGPPLADIGETPFLEQESARLVELRLAAVEQRLEAELALGAGPSLVDELQAIVRDQPLRERPAAQLMLALYRSGRQAEALTTYKRTRDRLVDELGIEPGRALKQLEQGILRQDPALEAPARSEPDMAANLDPLPRRWTRRTVALMATGAVAVAAAAVVVIALSSRERLQIRLAPDAVGVVRDGRLVDQAHVGVAPTAIASARGAIWIASADADSVSRLDPKTFDVRQTIPVGNGPSGIAIGGGMVWVANGLGGTVTRIDPKANKVVQTVFVGNGPAAIAYGLGSIWVANRADQTVNRIEPRTGRVLDTLAAGTDAAAIAAGNGAVWVVDQARGRIARVEPGYTEPVLTINVGNGPSAIALGAGSLWIANTLDSTVSRIDPRSNRVIATIPVGAGPIALAVASDGIWVANEFDNTLALISPQTNRVERMLRLGQRPAGVAVSARAVLVTVGASPASHRGGTLRLVSDQFPSGSLDPLNPGSYAAVISTNDGLTAFRRVGGVEGTVLVPDLGLDLPSPTDGGRTYTFRLRRGIHYSNGQLVRPEDFRRALRRMLIVYRDTYFYGAIVGAAACVSEPRLCDLSRGVVADDRAWTVTFHLERPDPDFLYELALPTAYAVPAATPATDVSSHALPATGAYMIAAYKPGRFLKLVRNPRFHVWSTDAQPVGFPDEIFWKLGTPPAAQVRAVETGSADVAFDGVPPSRLAEVETEYASQVRENLLAGTTFLFLNTRLPPFSDVRVRRAVSYAVDRAAFVHVLGGPNRAQPTCQILPPNFRGYRAYCPFTLQPSRAGIWQAPDIGTARRLVARSGTRGANVTLWIAPNHRLEGAIVVTLLERLGYRVHARQANDYYARIGDSRLKIQAGVHSWLPDHPAPAAFLNALFSCDAFRSSRRENLNVSEFCDPQIDRQIARARALETTDPAVASSLWSRIDRELVDQAPVVPLVNPRQVDFLSQRVGNYQYNPQWHMLFDQLWVR
jgi:peptide/nickel transport system substrate-binding protein